ncbi:D-amino acid dehydrogenase [Vibrio sp. Of7-15]|uniref:D-amino acid dehydrogenase n=1 Tax=Vibrio sp. Of7-15 TaxID=2724879 RepID=UPI001EF163E4|nr:D-amino acid dehydrogenase [Vibrio sp. Of7-15]MCG7497411.1 D-amino acid dehydrogenase [Vibrio sp. Of7-15]
MNVIVLGGGVIGLTSAWYLRQQGHDVTVIDRQARCADETSYANAGQISYGYSSPWAAPGIPNKAVKWLLQKHSPLKIKPSVSPQLYMWMSQMLMNCNLERYSINKSRMLRIANYSRDCLAELRSNYHLSYEGRQKGTLQVFRSEQQIEAIQKDLKLLSDSNINFQQINASSCLEIEPGLKEVKEKIIGGLHLPDDETGDCYQFCQQLATLAESEGVKFTFNTNITKLNVVDNKLESVETSSGKLRADAYVVALGSFSSQLLRELDLKSPIYPVKGYSLTLPIINSDLSPVSTVMDETYKVAITRFDDRIRVAGTAELAGFNTELPQKRKETIAMVVKDLFPKGGDLNRAEFWTGLRPMTPDGTPIIGKTPITNLYTNSGHGTLGWTMACGSAKLLSDIVSNKQTDIDPEGLNIGRYYAS